MRPVIQKDKTGCAIAASAVLANTTYDNAKRIANDIGVFASDSSLWSSTEPVRRILKNFNIHCAVGEQAFTSWSDLPDRALLSIKWHLEENKPFWHWVVFIRDSEGMCVFDSNARLKQNRRTDFARMKPKWYIEIIN